MSGGFNAGRATDVAIGLTVDGFVTIWGADVSGVWEMTDAEAASELTKLSGTGAISMGSYATGLYRETARFDVEAGVLSVGVSQVCGDRGATSSSSLHVTVRRAHPFEFDDGDRWDSVYRILVRAALSAEDRGEILVVGAQPYPDVDGPSAIVGWTTRDACPMVVVSARPTPKSRRWSTGGEDERTNWCARLSRTTVGTACGMALEAVGAWGGRPFDVGVGFLSPIESLTRSLYPVVERVC